MSKLKSYIRLTLKAIFWVAVSLVLIFILIAVLIQVPSIQTKIVHYATTFVSNKTHTKVEIKNVSISFPKAVVIEGLYLEDLKYDTLVYAQKAKINMALYDLLHNKIAVSFFALEDATIKLHSTKTDPIFNYNFLLTAFSDTTSKVKTDTLSASKWTFSIDKVDLQNVRFAYNDEFAGMNVLVTLQKSKISVDEIDLGKPLYQFNKLFVEGLTATILASKSSNTKSNPSTSILPKIGAKNLQLSNSMVSYTDSVGFLSVISVIDECELKDASIDLQKQLLVSDYLSLSKSNVKYHTFSPELQPDTTTRISTSANNWNVTLNRIALKDNSLEYKSGNKPPIKNVFDPNNLEYSHLILDATGLFYSPDLTKVLVTKFSATDQNNFAITGFETDFSMDQHSITAKKLKANTTNSGIEADFSLQYSSMAALADSMRFSNINLDLKNLRFINSDVLYFKSDLAKQSFFKNSRNVTTASG
ncbi:MAG TPA: hypothetical protein VFC67_21905, partial [Prolixibacteraceae bacterium]|nr:hypothetical protein [Prolixibacteraceae bacterium]